MIDDPQEHHLSLKTPELLGRERELAALNRMLADLFHGRGGKVLVSGDAGIGKTTLVGSLAASAQQRGGIVLSAACYELDMPPPHSVWRDVLRAARGENPFAGNSANSVDDLRRRVLASLLATGADGPLIVVLEDLQWADESSLDLLRYICHHTSADRLLLVATCRDQDLEPDRPFYRFLPQFIRESRPVRLALRPLNLQAITDLVQSLYAGLPDADRERLVEYLARYGEGNPFFVEELLGLLEYRQTLIPVIQGWKLEDLPDHPVPPLVRQVIDVRLMQLAPETLALLEIAAVFGIDVPIDLWAKVSSATPDELATAIDDALRVRVIEEHPGGNGYRFRHALIQGVVYERPNSLQRRKLHRLVAEALAGQPNVDPALVAHHFSQAADPRAADWLIEAGRVAARSFALRDAAGNYERALRVLDQDSARLAERTWLLCALAEANRYINITASLAYVNRAFEMLEQLENPAMRVLAIWCRARIRGFHNENVIDDLRQAAEEYSLLSSEEQDRILQTPLRYVVSRATLSQDLANYGQFHAALKHAQAFLEESDSPDSDAASIEFGNAYMGMGMAHAALGEPDAAREAFTRSREYFLKSDNYQMVAISLYWELSFVSQVYDAESPETRRALRQDEIEVNRRSELARAAPLSELISTSETMILDGSWADCRHVASARLNVPASSLPSARKLAHLDWLQGYPERATELVQSVAPLGPDEPPGKRMFLHRHEIQWIAAELALDRGDLETARRWIEAHERWQVWSGKVSGRYLTQLLWSRFHQLSGNADAAMQHGEEGLALARAPREPLGIIAAQRALGQLHVASGNAGRAATPLAEAQEIARACEAPFEIALTLVVQAEMLHASHLDGDAVRVLGEAREIATYLEAQPLLDRIDALLATVKVVQPRSAEVPFGLSPRELQVLGYVARGYTDARIAEALKISPRTVGGHLQSILNKTGATSRTAATALAYQHGILGGEG